MSEQAAVAATKGRGFRPVRLVLAALAVLALVSFAGDWYAGQVSLPRYCEQSEVVLQRLAAVATESRPAGNASRRDYVAAAKLEFLVPRTADEPLDAYLLRVRRRLEERCG